MANYAEKLTKDQQLFLADLFPGDGAAFDPETLAAFGADAGRKRHMPWAMVRPETHEQCVELLAWAERERMPIYPRARGTGTVGNATPVHGGVVVSTLRMDRIREIHPADFVAVVEPGVINGDLQRACAKQGVFYPPDPASVNFSTIGGNVATCAGGLRAVKYGVTREWVLGLTLALPGGRTVRTGGRAHKDVVGLDLTRLFVGSAGKLGLATEIILKLIPKPETSASLLAGFTDLDKGLEAMDGVFAAGILPTACEFMDSATIRALRGVGDVPLAPEVSAALLLKVDGTEGAVRAELAGLETVLARFSPSSLLTGMGDEEEALWEVRRLINPAAFQLGPDKFGEDIAVPRGSVGRAVRACHEIGEKFKLPIMCFGHLGDGNVHVNIMHHGVDPDELQRAEAAKEAVFRLALELGGTISGEHGTGLTKAGFVDEQLSPEALSIMSGVKAVFDPQGIMNPGKGW